MNFKKIIEGIENHNWSSEIEVGEFIGSLIKMSKCQNILEVGVFKGVTSCYIIDNLLDKGSYTGIDIKDFRNTSVKYFMQDHKFILGDSKIELGKLPEKSFDLIFIDSNHEFEHTKTEFQLCEKLIKQNGLILLHDCFYSVGVQKWVNILKTFSWFEVMILNTPDNRGLAVIKCLHK